MTEADCHGSYSCHRLPVPQSAARVACFTASLRASML